MVALFFIQHVHAATILQLSPLANSKKYGQLCVELRIVALR